MKELVSVCPVEWIWPRSDWCLPQTWDGVRWISKLRLKRLRGCRWNSKTPPMRVRLAEIWFGQHVKGVRNLIAITVSEGIGSGPVLNGQLVRGSTGAAGEFGHITIVEDGLECRCGNRGCWEVYASNSAAVRYYVQATSRRHNKKARANESEPRPTFENVLRRIGQGDLKAKEAIHQMAHYLGVGIALLVTGLAPDIIVIVGQVTSVWSQISPVIHEIVKRRLFTHAPTRIVPADPLAQPRLRGAIALMLQKHFGAPSVA
jgi:predicted NBD/HSP70 family sugar kinase